MHAISALLLLLTRHPRLYRAGVEHDPHHTAERLWWKVVLELRSAYSGVACQVR